MPDHRDPVADAIETLAAETWHAPQHQRDLERTLATMHARRRQAPFVRRHRAAIVGLLLLIAAGGVAGATWAWYTRANQYTFEVRLDGKVISRPRVLVKRGQTASVGVGNDGSSFTIYISYDGSTRIEGPEGIEMNVEIVEIDLPE